MKEGDLSKVFIGFMALLSMVAGALCIDRYRLLDSKIEQMKLYNESLRKSEKVARKDGDFRILVAREGLYGAEVGDVPEPVEYITEKSEKFGVRLDRIHPQRGRMKGNLQEVAIKLFQEPANVTKLCQLLFYLEEAYPGGFKVKEMLLQRKAPGNPWEARITVSRFTITDS